MHKYKDHTFRANAEHLNPILSSVRILKKGTRRNGIFFICAIIIMCFIKSGGSTSASNSTQHAVFLSNERVTVLIPRTTEFLKYTYII